MRKLGLFRRCAAALFALLLAAACFAMSVSASESIDTDRAASLDVYFGEDGHGFSGVEFSIYRVEDVSASGVYTLSGSFEDYSVNLTGLSMSEWRALAQTLSAYAARDGISPDNTASTGTGGHVTFAGLTPGLYLVTGSRHTYNGSVYTPEPALVSLPGDGDPWDYSVEMSCKFESTPDTPGTVTRKVLKIWDDDRHESERPTYVIAQLLENGRVADTVRLSEANNWSYTWEGLDSDSVWQVVEINVPDGYTVSISREGITFVITNTYKDKKPGETPPPSPQPSTPPSPTVTPPGGGTEKPPMIPQTGMIWWPVPLLACAGSILILAGMLLRRRHGGSDEK